MPDVATSLRLHNVHELMILAPVRQGFVEGDERRVSYATRLRTLLNLLFRPSQSTSERTLMPALNFSEDLRNLYHFNYGVVDRLQQSQLILSATFDSSWEMYFHNLVEKVGPFLDAVFFHCEGFEGRSCRDGYEKFADFIREHQIQCGMLYSATPELSADDLRLLRPYARGEGLKTPILSVKDQVRQEKRVWMKRYGSPEWQGVVEYKRLRIQALTQFFLSVWETRGLFTKEEKVGGRSAQEFFDNAVRFLAGAVVGEVATDAKGAITTVEIDEAEMQFAELKVELLKGEGDPKCEAWLEEMLKPEAKRAADAPIAVSALPNVANVQDGILEQRDSSAALLTFLRFPKQKAPEFLTQLRAGIEQEYNTKLTVNAGLTFAGLRRLGLGDETCELLPKEFQEGMELRAGVLGDIGWPSHPDYWRPIGSQGWFSIASIDLVVVFHVHDADSKAALIKQAEGLLRDWLGEEHDACLVHSEVVDRGGLDPFGFKPRDKAQRSQPAIDATKRISNESADQGYDNRIAPGNLILGYCDHRGSVASIASEKPWSDLFKDGTFLAIRKLAQNRAAYRRLVAENQELQSEDATLGVHVADDKSYDKEPEKSLHPNSHLRRSNPRFKDVPRIVRRSYTYASGAKDTDNAAPKKDEQGHMFMCYCASLAEQYEVIQRWINGGNSTGFLSSERDVVAGQHVVRKKPFSGVDIPSRVPPVSLRWGMYLFVPSKRSLELLAEVAERQQPSEFVRALKHAEHEREARRGAALLQQLDAIAEPKVAQQSWKQLFEEAACARDARAIWAAIRARGGRKDTPYGVLLGKRDLVMEVLENKGDLYSVREYRERFLNTAGDFYLGMDECPAGHAGGAAPGVPSYSELAKANVAANAVLSTKDAREKAARFAGEFLARGDRFDVKELVKHVIGNICAEFTGVPTSVGREEGLRQFLNCFVAITRYSSFPYPEKWVAEKAAQAGAALVRAYGTDPGTWTGKLKDELKDCGAAQVIRDAIIIANIGFVPPAISMLTGMLSKWINNGDIQQPRLRDRAGARSAILHEMKSDATFTTIYRTKIESDCNGDPNPGKYVVVGVQSAYVEDEQSGEKEHPPERWMFGGTYAPPDPGVKRGAHACPMQTQALEIIIGVATTLADHIHDRAKDCALIRLSPFTYEFETIGPRLPAAYSNADEPVSEKPASAASATSAQLTITSELEQPPKD